MKGKCWRCEMPLGSEPLVEIWHSDKPEARTHIIHQDCWWEGVDEIA